jgi:hypothetical protein
MKVYNELMGKSVYFLCDGQLKRGIVNYISHDYYKDNRESVQYSMEVEGEASDNYSKFVFPTLKEAIEFVTAPLQCSVEQTGEHITIEQ